MKIVWRQKLGNQTKPYLERWFVETCLGSIRLHHWFCGDDPRHFHDHPWDFWGIVLRGSYVDVSPDGDESMPQGKIFYRKAEHKHTVHTAGCWTLIVTGPTKRRWGFWAWNKSNTNLIWLKAKRYFLKHGHHQCE